MVNLHQTEPLLLPLPAGPCNLCSPRAGPSLCAPHCRRNNTTGIALRGALLAVTFCPGFVQIQQIVSGSLLIRRIALIDCATSHFHSWRKLAKLDNNLKRIMKSSLRKHLCPSVNEDLLCWDLSSPSLHWEPRDVQFSSKATVVQQLETPRGVLNPSLSTSARLACQIFCFNFWFH